MTYVINKNIPIPPIRRNTATYPWPDLQPGDSFVVPKRKGRAIIASLKYYNRTRSESVRVATRSISPDEIRVWRVA